MPDISENQSFGSGLVSALKSGATSTLGALPGAMIGGSVNGLFGLAGARLQYKYNKKLMALQNQYAIDAFNRENERQDYLMLNSERIKRHALANAGYSEADPNGTGVQTASINNQDVPTNPSAGEIPLGRVDLMSPFQVAQTRLMEKQAENVEADTEKKRAETAGQNITNYWLNAQNDADWNRKLAEIDKLKAEGEFTETQAYVAKELLKCTQDKTEAEINEINKHIDVYTKEIERIDKQMEVLREEVHTQKAMQSELRSRSNYNEASAELASSNKKVADATERLKKLEGDAQETRNGLRVKLAQYNIDLDSHDIKTLVYMQSHGFMNDAVVEKNRQRGRGGKASSSGGGSR